MTSFTHPRPGYELDWLATDAHGRVGLFSSGGAGPVPKAVVDHLADVEVAIGRLAELPIVGSCAESPDGAGDFSFWIEPCRRGIFGFDWGPVENGPYARFTVPSAPLDINQLEDSFVHHAASLVKLAIDFPDVAEIEADLLGVELYAVSSEPQ